MCMALSSPTVQRFKWVGYMKKTFFSKKTCIFILILLFIINIALLCAPAFGVYRGGFTHYSDTYSVKMRFNNGVARIDTTRISDNLTAYEVGEYARIDNKIIINATTMNDGANKYQKAYKLERKSVFKLYNDDKTVYTSAAAILSQFLIIAAYFVFGWLLVLRIKIDKENKKHLIVVKREYL